MSYQNHFKHADELVAHLNGVVPNIADPLLQVKYTGFVSVAAVTVYELAIKQIFIDFATKKHKVLGHFTESYFERINGRIKLPVVKDDYIYRFGERYTNRFKKNIEVFSNNYLASHKRDIRSSYANLITWRNDFAHEGKLNATAHLW